MKITNFVNGSFFLLIVFLLSSCANTGIMKRRYMPGYYVSKNTKVETVNKVTSQEIDQSDLAKIETAGSEQPKRNENEINAAVSLTSEFLKIPERLFKKRGSIILQHSDIDKKIVTERQDARNADDTKIDGFAIASLFTVILGIAAMFFLGRLLWGVAMVITGIALGIGSLNRIRKNPDKFHGKGFAIAGIVLGVIALVALVLLILLIIAFFV